MNLRLSDPAFLARAVASGGTPADTLLAEMKYTGYNVGQLVNNGTSIDGYTVWADYGFRHSVVASPYGTAGKAARFPTSGENGGSGNSRYAIHLRVPRTLRGGRDRIKWKVYFKTPATGNVCGQSGDGYPYLFWWGALSLRTSGGTGAVSALRVFTGSTQRSEMAYAYAASTWYLHTYDVKMGATGFVNVRVEKAADGSGVGEFGWSGDTGSEGATNGNGWNFGDDASVHGLTGTTAADSDTACFPVLGPVLLFEPGV
jgi:hypothetical protein